MPAQLLAMTEGPDILLDKPILLLGRHPECDIQIDSRRISRRHCCIAQIEDYLVVRDLGSTNGTRINGLRVQEGRLRPNDELTIGNSRYKVKWDTMEAVQAVPPVMERLAPRPGRLEAIDDLVLESCEEPVPLDEPAACVPAALQAAPPRPAQSAVNPDPVGMLILPENLELAPLNDFVPPPGSSK